MKVVVGYFYPQAKVPATMRQTCLKLSDSVSPAVADPTQQALEWEEDLFGEIR